MPRSHTFSLTTRVGKSFLKIASQGRYFKKRIFPSRENKDSVKNTDEEKKVTSRWRTCQSTSTRSFIDSVTRSKRSIQSTTSFISFCSPQLRQLQLIFFHFSAIDSKLRSQERKRTAPPVRTRPTQKSTALCALFYSPPVSAPTPPHTDSKVFWELHSTHYTRNPKAAGPPEGKKRRVTVATAHNSGPQHPADGQGTAGGLRTGAILYPNRTKR